VRVPVTTAPPPDVALNEISFSVVPVVFPGCKKNEVTAEVSAIASHADPETEEVRLRCPGLRSNVNVSPSAKE
jgi:hypothetical protein